MVEPTPGTFSVGTPCKGKVHRAPYTWHPQWNPLSETSFREPPNNPQQGTPYRGNPPLDAPYRTPPRDNLQEPPQVDTPRHPNQGTPAWGPASRDPPSGPLPGDPTR